jgi:tRNA(Ile)-lysidine synthase
VPPPAAEAQVVIPGRTPIPWGGGAIVTRTISREELSEPLSAGSGPLAHLDFDRTGPALALRRRRPGDRFHPLGAPGSRKLSDFFCDMHLPASLRDGVPLLVAAQPAGSDRAAPDPAGEIAWVVGSRISERFKVTPATRRILRVSQEASPAE